MLRIENGWQALDDEHRSHTSIESHRAVQATVKGVLAELASTITPGDTEESVAQRAAQMMANVARMSRSHA
ncbi:hypothetical protein H0E84_15165 [Luteimonas sp. SJ-92]|uniref:Uncharacterized protein n=1 Tax=Luteimonas salinisoli TaxID=2752307 RepID=A0A853JGY4_9GAMM|nr:hypothetical protein [Luteimonas salinisoli]NZA27720.1 hypothetical protein [Luteimonas salinisoli]